MKNIQQNTGRAKYSSIPFKGKDNGVCLVQKKLAGLRKILAQREFPTAAM